MRRSPRFAAFALFGAAALAVPGLLPAQAPPAPAAVGPRADQAAVAARLEAFVAEQMRDKALPALSLALVDD